MGPDGGSPEADRGGMPRRARRWPWVLLAVFIGGLWAALLFQSDWEVTDRLLGAALGDAADVREAVEAGDLAAAKKAAEQAHVRTSAVLERVDGPLWWLAGRSPSIGQNVRTAQAVAPLAEAMAALTVTRLDDVGDLVVGEADVWAEPGEVDLRVLADLRQRADGVSGVEEVVAAAEVVRAIDPAGLAASMVATRAVALELADGLVTSVERTGAVLDVVPRVLGAEGTRTYVLRVVGEKAAAGTLTVDRGMLSWNDDGSPDDDLTWHGDIVMKQGGLEELLASIAQATDLGRLMDLFDEPLRVRLRFGDKDEQVLWEKLEIAAA